MARAAGGTYEDTEGLINLPLTVKEIQAVVFFKQIEGDEYRVSLRSKGDIDIGAVAKEFGGGGHKNAAGCTVTGADRRAAEDCSSRRSSEAIDAERTVARCVDVSLRRSDAHGRSPRHRQAVGPTSHDVVARVRRVLGERRIGHTGTLDPAASGVLPLVLGRATRLARFLSAATRRYEADDPARRRDRHRRRAGQPVGAPYDGPLPARDAIERALDAFRGTFLQQPPAYLGEEDRRHAQLRRWRARRARGRSVAAGSRRRRSAAVAGARDRAPIELARAWTATVVALRVDCSAGFYVRSLAHDLGRAAGHRRAPGGAAADAERRRHARRTRVPLATVERESRRGRSRRSSRWRACCRDLPSVVLTDEGVRARGARARPRAGDVDGGFAARRVRRRAPQRMSGCSIRPGELVGDRRSRAGAPGFCIPAVVLV